MRDWVVWAVSYKVAFVKNLFYPFPHLRVCCVEEFPVLVCAGDALPVRSCGVLLEFGGGPDCICVQGIQGC